MRHFPPEPLLQAKKRGMPQFRLSRSIEVPDGSTVFDRKTVDRGDLFGKSGGMGRIHLTKVRFEVLQSTGRHFRHHTG